MKGSLTLTQGRNREAGTETKRREEDSLLTCSLRIVQFALLHNPEPPVHG